MSEKVIKYSVLVLYTILLTVPFYAEFFNVHADLPVGCDEFGYLNMAKAVSRGALFKEHAARPFDRELLEHLKHSPYEFSSYEYLICPHAYNLNDKKFKVINQYPPGTGLVLGILPFHQRKTAAPVVYAVLLVLFLILAFKAGTGNLSWLQLNMVAVVTAAAFIGDYFFNNYGWINSHAPTFGMLVAAGYLLDKRPGISMMLLGTSVVFRVPNGIFFPLFLFVYLGKGARWYEYFSKETLFKTVKAVILFLVGGAGFYYLYVWILLGNPFLPTYPPDFLKLSMVASIREIPGNIVYHMSIYNLWFLFHALIFGLMICLWRFKKMPAKWIAVAAAIALLNYGFCFIHRRLGPIEQRYAYASGMIVAGIFLRYAEELVHNTVRLRRAVHYAGILSIVAAVVFSLMTFPRQNARELFYRQIQAYDNCFSGYDVVWAGTRSGTVEYATGKPAFRFQWGARETRNDVLSWLHRHGYRQAIWMNDLEKEFLDTVDVEAELKSIQLGCVVKRCRDFGTVIAIGKKKDLP